MDFKFNFKNLKEYGLYLVELFLHKTKIKLQPHLENGFRDEKPKEQDWDDEVLGAKIKLKVLEKDYQWDKYRSPAELQERDADQDGNKSETMNCTIFAVYKVTAGLVNRMISLGDKATEDEQEIVKIFEHFDLIDNGYFNASERYGGNVAGTTRRGNSIRSAVESIRDFGLVPEKLMPWVDGWNNYYNRKATKPLIPVGQELLEYVNINWGWIYPVKFNAYKQYSPIGTSIFAWERANAEGIIPASNRQRNHCICNDGYLFGKYDKVWDSYEPFAKKISWYSNLGMGMVMTITLKKKLDKYTNLIKKGYKYVQRVDVENGGHGELYEITADNLSKEEPMDLVQDNLRRLYQEGKIKAITEQEYKKYK